MKDSRKPQASRVLVGAGVAALVCCLVVLIGLYVAARLHTTTKEMGTAGMPCAGDRPCQSGLRCVTDSADSRAGKCALPPPPRQRCTEAEDAKCGGRDFCSLQGGVATCGCARADGVYVQVPASDARPPACQAQSAESTALDAYRRAGGTDPEESLGNYLAWDAVLGRWSTRLRARARDTAAWDEAKDPLPVFNSDGPPGFCVDRLPARDGPLHPSLSLLPQYSLVPATSSTTGAATNRRASLWLHLPN